MAPPSNISQLPEDLVEELNKRLADSKYFDIDGHWRWLNEEIERRELELEPISRSAVGRHSRMRKLQTMSIQETVRELHAVQMEFGDDPLTFIEGGNRIAQMLAWKQVEAARNGDVPVDEDFLKSISLAFKRMADTSRINEERERRIREDERMRAAEAAAKVIDDNAKAQGLTDEQARFWREKILGIKQ